jgi:hypothetical protein
VAGDGVDMISSGGLWAAGFLWFENAQCWRQRNDDAGKRQPLNTGNSSIYKTIAYPTIWHFLLF